jgi:hypothetical protein
MPPASGGGMPKWLIIVLVLLLIVIVGCCGGFVACRWACAKAVSGAQGALQTATQRAHDEMMAATQRAADEAKRQAEQGLRGTGITAPEPGDGAGGGAGAPAPGARGATGGGGAPAAGTGGGRPAVNLGGGMPANFPKDLPVMAGFTSAGVSISDSAQGTGMVMLSGKGTRQDAVAYYEKQMKDQGWAESRNMEIGESNTMVFTKDTRQATIQAVNTDGNTMLTIRYEPKP